LDSLEEKCEDAPMSDETKSDFDPRFDPAFQRGFDLEKLGAPAVGAAVPPAPSSFSPPPPSRPPVTAPPLRSVPPVSPAAAVGPVVVALQDAEEPAADRADDASSSRNPFLIVLLLVAVVLIAAGIWLFVRSGAEFNGREVRSQGDYMSLDAIIHMAPFVALLGVATAIGVLFVFAVRWRKRR
jgi:hypothetical protein